ncbi:hypothetical protein [Ornithinimicrobium cerasi]|uniref:hypothetical protein n=1 Tax=Ornithinimicrobium cerasi TaxID=2248773 RepID=UPI00137B519B|nr:hypothetical protein [Ornithinimicrobium cerasi]
MRGRRGFAAALILVLLVGVGCTDESSTEGSGTSDPAPTTESGSTTRASVDEDGFSVALDGVLVEGPAGVADPGTAVVVSLLERESPDPDADMAAVVDVVIGDHLQPQEPVSITFDLAEPPGETVEHVVLRSDSGRDNYVTIDHDIAGDKVVVTTEHLSVFSLVQFDPRQWLGELTKQIELALGLQYPQPDCAEKDFGHATDLGDVYFMTEGPGLGTVYLCADRLPDDELSMQFYSNGPVAWEITADPAPPSTMPIVQLRLGDLMATAGYRLVNDYPDNRALLSPGAQIGMRSTEDALPVSYTGEVDLLWGGVALGVEAALGVASIGQAGKWQKLRDAADLQDAVSCLSGTVSAGLDPELGPMISTATTCVQRMMGEMVGSADALLLLRLGIVSRLLMVAPQGVLSALIAKDNSTFSVDLLSIRARAAEGYLVPEYCEQPERRAAVGQTEVDGRYTVLEGPLAWDGPGAQIVAMTCSSGGVTWPGVLLVYDRRGERVGEFFLSEIEPTSFRGSFDVSTTTVDGDVVVVPYGFETGGSRPYTPGTMRLTWDHEAGRPTLSGGTATASVVEAPAGGRGLGVDGDWAPDDAEPWLVSRLGSPDQVTELTDCFRAGITGRRLTWGGLDVTILTEPVPEETYLYGFAYPVGAVSGWTYDLERDGGTSSRHRVVAEGVRLPIDVDTLRAEFSTGWDYADTVTAEDGTMSFQAFSGDVTGILYRLDGDGRATGAVAGLSCDQ